MTSSRNKAGSTTVQLKWQPRPGQWTRGVCPNCGYTKADVDPDGILWCPACGYSKKGCYT